jgi:hypothetical protein
VLRSYYKFLRRLNNIVGAEDVAGLDVTGVHRDLDVSQAVVAQSPLAPTGALALAAASV